MFNRIKAYRLKKELDRRRDALRRKATASNEYSSDDWRKYATEDERKEFDDLVVKHHELTGQTSEYFDPKRHGSINMGPDSPEAFRTVEYDRSTKVSYIHEASEDKYFMYKDAPGYDPIFHPERREVVELTKAEYDQMWAYDEARYEDEEATK